MPGQSMRYIRFINVIYCHTFVSPGIGAVVHTFFLRRVLIIEDFPVLGYPMKPTEICFLELCRDENCRNNEINVPFPKLFVRLAWKARVGYSCDRIFTHLA